jgi:hypothetical protein
LEHSWCLGEKESKKNSVGLVIKKHAGTVIGQNRRLVGKICRLIGKMCRFIFPNRTDLRDHPVIV